MKRSLVLASWRFMLRHPWQFGLGLVGISLGVAVVVAVDLANQSAGRAFELSVERLTGRATHQVIGGPGGIPEAVYVDLRLRHGVRNSTPVIDGVVRFRGETFRLLGLDPFSEHPFRDIAAELDASPVGRLLTDPGAVAVTGRSADRLGLVVGETVLLGVNGRSRPATIAGFMPDYEPYALDGVMLTDIANAQALLERYGRIDRIDLILDGGEAETVRALLPAGLSLEMAGARERALGEMSQAFQINLTAMSLLAVLVGGFLIFNTMTFSIVQRRPQLAVLRMLGAGRGELFQLVIVEALVLGAIGGAIGLGLGALLATGLLRLVSRTINDLYFVLNVSQLDVTFLTVIKGLGLGILATVFAAIAPAAEAARTVPVVAHRRSSLERRVHALVPRLAVAGILLMLAGWLLARMPGAPLEVGFAGLFLVLAGYSLLVPFALLWVSRLASPVVKRLFPVTGQMALRGIRASLSRTGPATSALTVAVAATLGVAIMIDSFRGAVSDWLDQTLRSDLYVSAAGDVPGKMPRSLDTRVLQRVREIPGIAALSTGRRRTVFSSEGPIDLFVLDPGVQSAAGFRLLSGDRQLAWQAFLQGRSVLVSEPLAEHWRLAPGDTVTLETDRAGSRKFNIAGVFRDYGSSRGVVLMERQLYDRLWADPEISSIGVLLGEHADPGQARSRVQQALADVEPPVLVRASREIREASLSVFDRTFAVTRVLRLLVVGVAFVGILSALMALQLERAREHAILRATGATPGQVVQLGMLEACLMGLVAGVLAMPVGWMVARLLIQVIQLRSFGWSMDAAWSSGVFGQTLLLAVFAALLGSLYPAWQMARSRPVEALREE